MNASRTSRSLGRPSMAEDLGAELRRQILGGEMKPGERIDQDQIAAQYGVSRLPVREALIALAQEGLVQTLPRRGTYVADLSPEDVLDQYELYGLVSGLAAARAAERLDDEAIARLRVAHEEFVNAKDSAGRERWNEEFHRIINTAAGSRLRSMIRLISRSLPTNHYKFASGWSKLSARHHDKVLRAIERRDPAAARAAMEEHLVAGGEEAVIVLEKMGFWADQPS